MEQQVARYGKVHHGGRKRGPMARTLAIRDFCRSILEDPEYRADLLVRARTRQLGSFEQVMWAYGYGVPKRELDLCVKVQQEDLTTLSAEELEQRARQLLTILSEVRAVEEALSAEYVTEPASRPALQPADCRLEAPQVEENPLRPQPDPLRENEEL